MKTLKVYQKSSPCRSTIKNSNAHGNAGHYSL
jgi:hypothetical protein